jgi:hypothetical protein
MLKIIKYILIAATPLFKKEKGMEWNVKVSRRIPKIIKYGLFWISNVLIIEDSVDMYIKNAC